MDNPHGTTPIDDQSPVLITWRMSWQWLWGSQAALFLLVFLVVVCVKLVEGITVPLPSWAELLICIVLLSIVSIPIPCLLKSLECRANMIDFVDCLGRRNLTRWEDIWRVRRITPWLVEVIMREGMEPRSGMDLQDGRRPHPIRRYALAGMPTDKILSFLTLIHEASNARIVGFD